MNFFEELEDKTKQISIKTLNGDHEVYSKMYIYGLPGSGKTTLCVELLKQCVDKQIKCLFIDTENKLRSNLDFRQFLDLKKEEIMKYVVIMTNITQNNRDQLLKEIKNQDVEIVIVDSFTNLFINYLKQKKRAELRDFMNELTMAANGKTLITTHHARNDHNYVGTSNICIYGGDSICYYADEQVKLTFYKRNYLKRIATFERRGIEAQLPNPIR